MNNIAPRPFEGEILTPGSKAFGVSYYRYHSECIDWYDSIEECLQFLREGEDYGDLSASKSMIFDRAGNVLRTPEEIWDAL